MVRIRIQDLNISPLQRVCIRYEYRDGSLKDPGPVVTKVEKSGLYKDINIGIFTRLYVYEVAAKENSLIIYLEEDCFADLDQQDEPTILTAVDLNDLKEKGILL